METHLPNRIWQGRHAKILEGTTCNSHNFNRFWVYGTLCCRDDPGCNVHRPRVATQSEASHQEPGAHATEKKTWKVLPLVCLKLLISW